VTYPEISSRPKGLVFLPSLPPFVPSPTYSFLFTSFPPFLCLPSFPPLAFLRSRTPKIQLGGLRERRELPQRGLRRSCNRNQIWCILPFKISGGNSVNYFSTNKLIELTTFVQFKRMLNFCLED